MITIRQNPNFAKWFQVYAFGKFVDEFNRQAKAVRFAKELAKQEEHTHVNVEGEAIKV
tara:strand:- start:5022 stop:5195 length:174 start_codon:yes stop_codon:yes gene_type:complete